MLQEPSKLESPTITSTYPFTNIVKVEIHPERIEEFLKVIEIDAIGSRTKENGGCLRFDVLRSKLNPCEFTFYEIYKDEEAAKFHKTTEHFKVWADFKQSGGVASQTNYLSDAIFLDIR